MKETAINGFSNMTNHERRIDSNFRLIVVAALRSKQLLYGSKPRIEVDPVRRRNTSIAVEEVKRGLVLFRLVSDQKTRVKALDRPGKPWGNSILV